MCFDSRGADGEPMADIVRAEPLRDETNDHSLARTDRILLRAIAIGRRLIAYVRHLAGRQTEEATDLCERPPLGSAADDRCIPRRARRLSARDGGLLVGRRAATRV